MLPTRETLIHCAWTIALLLLLVIGLVSFQIGDDSDVVALISVATGLVSLVVGIIAIIYAFFTNGSLSSTSDRLEKYSKSIEEAARATVLSIDNVRNEISPIAKMAQQVAEMHSNMPITAQGGQTGDSPPQTTGQLLDSIAVVDYFLFSGSWLGLLTIYAAVQRWRAGKPFNAYLWTSSVGGISPDYAIGYLVCTVSTGMIQYDHLRFLQEGNIWITDVHTLLRDRISPVIVDNLSRQGLTPEDIRLRTEQKAKTETYISSNA